MRNRIFFKLLAAFVLVIVAATITLDISIRRAWETQITYGFCANVTKIRSQGKTLRFSISATCRL